MSEEQVCQCLDGSIRNGKKGHQCYKSVIASQRILFGVLQGNEKVSFLHDDIKVKAF